MLSRQQTLRETVLRRHRMARERLARQHEDELRALDALHEPTCVFFSLEWSPAPTPVLDHILGHLDMRDFVCAATCRLLGDLCPRVTSWPCLALQRFPWLRELLGPRRVQTTSVETYRSLCRRQVEAQKADPANEGRGAPSVLTSRLCASHADFGLLDDFVVSIELAVKAPRRRVFFEASALPRFNADNRLVMGPFWTPSRGPSGLAAYCLNDRPAGESWARSFPELADWLGDAPRAAGSKLALTVYVSRRSLLSTVKLYEAEASNEAVAQRALHFAHARAPAACRLVADLICLAPSMDLQTGQIQLAAYRRPLHCVHCATLTPDDQPLRSGRPLPPTSTTRTCAREDLDAPGFLTYLSADLPWGIIKS